jgi:hypothetical protein
MNKTLKAWLTGLKYPRNFTRNFFSETPLYLIIQEIRRVYFSDRFFRFIYLFNNCQSDSLISVSSFKIPNEHSSYIQLFHVYFTTVLRWTLVRKTIRHISATTGKNF